MRSRHGKTTQEAIIVSVYKPEFQITKFITSRLQKKEKRYKQDGRRLAAGQ